MMASKEYTMDATSLMTRKILKLIPGKDLAARLYKNPPRDTKVMDARFFSSLFSLETWEVLERKIVTIQDREPDGRHILFLHGGSYIVEASTMHRRLIQKLVKNHHMTVSFVDYPLAPEHTWRETRRMVLAAYAQIVKKFPKDEFFLFGDSAGGGLALAVLQELAKQNVMNSPKKTVLCSPWLDLSLQNPLIAEYEESDPVLSVEGLRYAAKMYSGGDDLRHPFLSPMFATVDNLGDILLYVGSQEIFYPDCLQFKKSIEAADGSSVTLKIGEGMMHDWVLFPFNESKSIPAQIDAFFQKST